MTNDQSLMAMIVQILKGYVETRIELRTLRAIVRQNAHVLKGNYDSIREAETERAGALLRAADTVGTEPEKLLNLLEKFDGPKQ